MKEKRSYLGRLWFSYLELCDLMLNLIYASCSGSLELYLSCIEEVIPGAFANGHQNYMRYFIPFLNDLNLCVRMPESFAALNKGKFSVQMGDRNHFGQKCKADKNIQSTINCKMGGGCIELVLYFCPDS